MKLVINRCYGGFGLSHEAIMRYAELKGIKLFWEDDGFITSYYTVPVHEFRILEKEAKETRSYSKMNGVYFSGYDMERNDPHLVQVVEEMGIKANGRFANLTIVDIPDDVNYEIDEYDGIETVHEVHRTWY
jgi:hypothetical protein